MLSLVLLETAFCFSLLTMLLILDNTGGVVNKINNLGDVGVEGCVGGVAKLLILLVLVIPAV